MVTGHVWKTKNARHAAQPTIDTFLHLHLHGSEHKARVEAVCLARAEVCYSQLLTDVLLSLLLQRRSDATAAGLTCIIAPAEEESNRDTDKGRCWLGNHYSGTKKISKSTSISWHATAHIFCQSKESAERQQGNGSNKMKWGIRM